MHCRLFGNEEADIAAKDAPQKIFMYHVPIDHFS